MACAFVCVMFLSESTKWVALVDDRPTGYHVPGDVISVNGDMDKQEKSSYIRLLTRDITLKDYLPVATATARTDIDQKWMEWIDQIGLPQDVLIMLQEMGRNAPWQPSMIGAYHVHANWK